MRLTDAQRELVHKVDCKYPDDGDIKRVSEFMPKCHRCGTELIFSRSYCQDLECCNNPNWIRCTNVDCTFEVECYGPLVYLFEILQEGDE